MSANQQHSDKRENYGLERLNALTDGVIAIALTLLVLGIDIPSDHNFTEDGLMLFLIKLEPGLIAYATSFVVVAVYWAIHHRIYGVLAFSNGTIVVLNILLLFSISLIPFVAKMKALYRYDAIAVLVYATTHIVSGLILYGSWKYFMRNKELLKYDITAEKDRMVSIGILMIPIVSIAAIGFSFVNIHVGTYLFFLIPILYFWMYSRSKPLFQKRDAR